MQLFMVLERLYRGVDGTANTIADEIFGVKAVGTMAHSGYNYLKMNIRPLRLMLKPIR